MRLSVSLAPGSKWTRVFYFQENKMRNRVIFFIDGFNLYHALESNTKFHKYKWLNLRKLTNCYITKNDQVEDILYFTALASWSQNKVKRHKIFIRALELHDIKIIYGEFKRRDKHCPLCNRNYKTFEEKQTDVNMAIQLFELAIKNKFDKAIIVSGDSDLIPSISAVRRTFPDKKIGIVIPIGRRAEALKQSTDFYMKMKEKHLISSIFDQEIRVDEKIKLMCPPSWR